MKFNKARRQVLTAMAGATAASLATPVLSAALPSTRGSLTGQVVSTIYEPHKLLSLTNSSNKPIVIEQFEAKALMFDGEMVNCNAACVGKSITVPANSEIHVHFDKRKLSDRERAASGYLNVQSRVRRLSQGTRVIPVQLDVVDGLASWAA